MIVSPTKRDEDLDAEEEEFPEAAPTMTPGSSKDTPKQIKKSYVSSTLSQRKAKTRKNP